MNGVNLILFKDLLPVETPLPVAGWLTGWVDGWGGHVKSLKFEFILRLYFFSVDLE